MLAAAAAHANSCNYLAAHKFVTVDQSCWVARTVVRARGAGKAIPVQDWPGPEGSRKLRFPDECGKIVDPTYRPPFLPRHVPGTHFC